MDPVAIPADTSWQSLIYMLVIAIVPILLGYLEKIRRDLAGNTSKTEAISHSVNGSLDIRLKAFANEIKTDIGEAIAENYVQLEQRINDIDKRLNNLERKTSN